MSNNVVSAQSQAVADVEGGLLKAYGGVQPAGSVNAEGFREHDHGQAWDDDGAAESVALSLKGDIEAYGAEQGKNAILSYLGNAILELAVVRGQVVAQLDASNNIAPYGLLYQQEALWLGAIAQAESSGDQEMLEAIGRFHDRVFANFRRPAKAVATGPKGRPFRPGNTRPPAGPRDRADAGPRRNGPAARPNPGRRPEPPATAQGYDENLASDQD